MCWGSWKGELLTGSSDSVLGQGSTYGYDEFNRLTSRTVNAGTVQNYTWVYDRYGNRWQQNALNGGSNSQLSFNPANNQVIGYTYDAAGNMTNDGFHTYTYDAEGHITAVDGGATASYVYNALNQRVRATAGGTITEYVFNAAGARVSEWNGATHAQLKGKYYWGSAPVAYYAGSAAHFEHQDWLGTERLRTTYNGGVEGSYISLPFGDGQATTGADTDANHYATLDHDAQTNTDYAQFRQYANMQGRWLSPDPYSGSYDAANPQSSNRYVYGGNNPLAMVDHLGLDDGCDDTQAKASAIAGKTGPHAADSSDVCPTVDSGSGSGGSGDGGGINVGISYPDGTYIDQNTGQIYLVKNGVATPVYDSPYTIYMNVWGTPLGPNSCGMSNPGCGLSYQFAMQQQGNAGNGGGGGGGGGGASAPNNYTKLQNLSVLDPNYDLKKLVYTFCKDSAGDRVTTSMRNGAISGTASGAVFGFATGEVTSGEISLGASGPVGAYIGAHLGGVMGTIRGLDLGLLSAGACALAGAY